MEKCNSCQHWRPDGQKQIGTCAKWSQIRGEGGSFKYTEPFECDPNFGCQSHKEAVRFTISSFEFEVRRRAPYTSL